MESLSEDWISLSDVLMQSLKNVFSSLKNKKQEVKTFWEYINANNSYEFKILAKIKMINSSSISRLVICKYSQRYWKYKYE